MQKWSEILARPLPWVVHAALCLGLIACGGGGGGGVGSGGGAAGDGSGSAGATPPTAPVVAPPTSNSIVLQSEPGDFIGQGKSFSYNASNALIVVGVSVEGRLTISVRGDEQWTADFVPPAGTTVLRVGRYDGISALPALDPSKGAFRWFGGGRGCAASEGWVVVDQVAYSGNLLASISLRFARYCDGSSAALRGELKWTSSDTLAMTATPTPTPANLWRPPAAAVPATGNYVYLESGAGDPVGLGRAYGYTPAEATIFVALGPSGEFAVQVTGHEAWRGLFQAPDRPGVLLEGYYAALRRTPMHNPGRGGLNWSGEGRSCVALDGWVAVDRIVMSQSVPTALELRFEQRCEGSGGVLRGALRWSVPVAATAPPPLSAPGSWSADSQVPATGNYLFMQSGHAAEVGGRRTYLATPVDAVMTVREVDGVLSVESNGEQHGFGSVKPVAGAGRLRTGVYTGLGRYLFGDPPGQQWTLASGCPLADSWLAIDAVRYNGNQLSEIRLRFDGRCSDTGEVQQGQLQWSDTDVRQPLGPQPVPASLWQAPAGATPAGGNYVYLEADPYRSISSDQLTRYTQANAVLTVAAEGSGIAISVRGEEYRDGSFVPMAGRTRLEPGYYAGLRWTPFRDAAKGGTSWTGDTHGCTQFSSSFAVDSVAYSGDRLDAIDLRFEQNCTDATVAVVRGQIHWDRSDATAPPGPVSPPPSTLWRPPAGATPASGTYLYLQSEAGDFIGSGQTVLLTPATQPIVVTPRGRGVDIETGASQTRWAGHLEPMSSRMRLEPGFYGKLKLYASSFNPARGGISWSGQGHGCNDVLGWFVVDSVSYDDGVLTALQARFEQYCETSPAPLRGEIRWSRP